MQLKRLAFKDSGDALVACIPSDILAFSLPHECLYTLYPDYQNRTKCSMVKDYTHPQKIETIPIHPSK